MKPLFIFILLSLLLQSGLAQFTRPLLSKWDVENLQQLPLKVLLTGNEIFDSALVELGGHEFGMGNGDTESDAANSREIRFIPRQCADDCFETLLRERVSASVNAFESLNIVTPIFPKSVFRD